MKRSLLSLLMLVWVLVGAYAKTTISVVTSYPSDREVYTLWGHTALMVENGPNCVIYNYGVFEFTDGFVYKFVSGQTDYRLDIDSPNPMMSEIVWKNSYAYVQLLNLTDEEAETVAAALAENLKPENCFYRYKFFSDNCATRPQRLLEKYVKNIRYAPLNNKDSYRDKVHVLCRRAPWLRMGIDLCLGSGADEVIPDSMVTFLPVSLLHCFDSATVESANETVRPLVKQKLCLFTPKKGAPHYEVSFLETPLPLCVALLIVALVSLLAAVRKASAAPARIFGSIFFLVAGVLGLLIFYLVFFSTHECTSPNFNLLWMNPLHLVTSVLLMVGARGNFSRVWLIVDLLLCTCYLLMIAPLPQTTCVEFVILSITLIISLLAYLWNDRRFFLEKFNKKSL